MKKVLLLATVFTVVFALGIFAEDEKQFRFAEALFSDSDYYRAIGEYKRYIYYNEKGSHAKKAGFMIGLAYMNAGKYDEAAGAFEGLESKYAGKVKELSIIAKSEAYHMKKDYVFSNSVIDRFVLDYPEAASVDSALYLRGWNFFYMKKWDEAKAAFETVKADGAVKNSALAMIENIAKKDKMDSKSSVVAAVLSFVLPGAGHFYCGRWADGLVALVLDGVFIYQAYSSFQRKDLTGQIIYGIPAVSFYSSAIYGAVAAADKFNEDELEKFIGSAETFKVDIISTEF